MEKQGTYLIVAAMLMMVAPYILTFFGAYELSESTVFPMTAILLGVVGVGFHLIQQIRTKTVTFSGSMLLVSVLTIIIGFSLMMLKVTHSKYVLLAGTLMVAIWLMIPTKKGVKN